MACSKLSGSLKEGHPGVLVDERYGQAVIDEVNRSPERQTALAVPIEHSGQDWFGLEWGGLGDTTWTDHLSKVQPDFAKILVRDNPAFDTHERQAQLTHLRTISELLHEMEIPLLYELLVPATDAQKRASGGDADAYDRDMRPRARHPADRRQSRGRCGADDLEDRGPGHHRGRPGSRRRGKGRWP